MTEQSDMSRFGKYNPCGERDPASCSRTARSHCKWHRAYEADKRSKQREKVKNLLFSPIKFLMLKLKRIVRGVV